MGKLRNIWLFTLLFVAICSTGIAATNAYDVLNKPQDEIVVYPNPVLNNELNIRADQDIIEVRIINVLGQEVFHRSFVDQTRTVNLQLDISDKGLFFVNIKIANGQVITKRILIK